MMILGISVGKISRRGFLCREFTMCLPQLYIDPGIVLLDGKETRGLFRSFFFLLFSTFVYRLYYFN